LFLLLPIDVNAAYLRHYPLFQLTSIGEIGFKELTINLGRLFHSSHLVEEQSRAEQTSEEEEA